MYDYIDERKFNLIFGGMLLYGFIVNALECLLIPADFISGFGFMYYIIYVICLLAGMALMRSESMNLSFLGYNMVVLPMGLTINSIVSYYYPYTVFAAFFATTVLVLFFIMASTIANEFFLGLGGTLFMSLIACIVANIVLMIFGIHLGIIDFIVTGIFCLYVGYDWQVAQNCELTASNAVNCACELYLDIINIFIRVLEILGDRDD